ncbi:MAG TPA: hypothetical protein VF461_06155 [Gemmatimonadaceae bacterium]
MRRPKHPWTMLVGLWLAGSRVGAQTPIERVVSPCDGRTITRIDIRPGRPPFTGHAAKWRTVARALGLHHATTRPRVIQAFMALHVGEACTEFRRAESERVLRAQPFLADAKVRVIADSTGDLAAIVETTDEIPVLVGGRLRGIGPDALSLGNGNVAGQGLLIQAGWEAGRAYQMGFGVRLTDYATFDRPYVFNVEAFRYRIGQALGVELGHPFFTDLQRISWHAGAAGSTRFPGFARPARDPLALEVQQRAWDLSGVLRVFGTRTIGLLGGAVTGRKVDPAVAAVVVSDSGFLPDTGIALRDRYHPFQTTRVGPIVGLRRVSYVAVSGFDALTGSQDAPSGLSGALYLARGFASPVGQSDAFLSGATYAGYARRTFLIANQAEVEGRRDMLTRGWNSIIGSTRSALYWGQGPGTVLVLDDEYSAGINSVLPLQLTLGDPIGGVLGYHRTGLAGSRRNVARSELRHSWADVVRGADLGVALFGQVGTLWSGDAPYGWTGSRGSVGLSLLGAYPTRSKRVYHIDLGFPLTRGGPGGGRFEIRFGSDDRTSRFWEEPADVAQARTGANPATLFAWPTR